MPPVRFYKICRFACQMYWLMLQCTIIIVNGSYNYGLQDDASIRPGVARQFCSLGNPRPLALAKLANPRARHIGFTWPLSPVHTHLFAPRMFLTSAVRPVNVQMH